MLALAQSRIIQSRLEQAGYEVEQLVVTTKGDRERDVPISALGGDGPFVRDVERALLEWDADVAVHCVKDLPYDMAEGLVIGGILDVADPRDCLITRKDMDTTSGSFTVGTGSPRRITQLKKLYPNAVCKGIRGNITTRLEKLEDGEYDGVILAKAGIDRAGIDLSDFSVRVFEVDEMIPAVGQGMLACQCRAEDRWLIDLLYDMTPPDAFVRYRMEREVFCNMRCDCRTAVGIHARMDGGMPKLLMMQDGQ